MSTRRLLILVPCAVLALVGIATPQEREPVPRLEAGGPIAPVQALAFSPDGRTLYEAGFDKVVRIWRLDDKTGRFALDSATFRVPIGPGFDGAINALALSPDGAWLAAGGLGAVRGRAGFHEIGLVASARGMSDAMREDEGAIHVFHTRTGELRQLRGHRGAVLALAFAPGQGPLLVSAAEEAEKAGRPSGVLRVWDVNRKAEIARTTFLPDSRVSTDLAVWGYQSLKPRVGVAVAWGDAQLRFWESDRADAVLKTGKRAFATTHLAGVEHVAAAVHLPDRGEIEFRSADSGQVRREAAHTVALPAGHFPLALRALDVPRKGRWGRAAVVARVPADEDAYVLHVVDLTPGNQQPVQASIPLWKRGNRLPALAVTPGGRTVAVAGAPDNAVRILSLEDLPNAAKQPPQLLRSAGLAVRSAMFVTDGKSRGLAFAESARKQPGERIASLRADDLIFDVARRAVTDKQQGWKPDVLDAGAWRLRVEQSAPDARRLTSWSASVVRDGQLQGSAVKLAGVRAVTDYALRPPDALLNVPVLAVAFLDDAGQPMLALYNAATGDQVRQLAGHLGPVRSVGFSGDGRLLCTAGEDHVACVWSLTSLPQHLGRRGFLHGLDVRQEKGRLVVTDVAEQGPAKDRLDPGDTIDGLVEAGKLGPLTSREQLLDALLLKRPGQSVTLRIAHRGGGRGDVILPVGQAVDEWKPLFSLFVTRSGRPGEYEWIAWNPTGPYDARDIQAERHLGWHFNPAQPGSAPAFAAAAQYRERRQRRGIVRHLLTEGTLSAALAAWEKEDRGRKLPEASLRLWLDDDVGLDPRHADGRGRFAVTKPPTALHLVMDDLPPERFAVATWHIEGLTAAPRRFADSPERTLSADLSALKWPRGTHTIRVHVRTNDEDPQQITRDLALRYHPPPPAVTADLPDGRTVSDATPPGQRRLELAKPEFRVRAQVTPSAPGEAVTVRLRQTHAGKERLSRDWHTEKALALDEPLQLGAGENLLEVSAVNRNSLPGEEELETTRLALRVVFLPPAPDPAPRITLDAVLAGETRLPLEIGKPLVVEIPDIRLLGSITAVKELAEASLALDAPGKSRALEKFVAARHRAWEVRETVRLAPGAQKFHISAGTGTSARAEAVADIYYRPRLPEVVVDAPERLDLYEGHDPPEVSLRGRFVPPFDPHPYTAVLLVNGQEREAIKSEGPWTVKVALDVGTHLLQVRLRNAWGAVASAEGVQFRRLRPPHVVEVAGAKLAAKPFADTLSARLRSALELDRDSIEVQVNGDSVRVQHELTKAGQDDWQVHLKDVPLREGDNTIRLWVRNAEARCRKPAEWTVRYTPPAKPAPPPEVAILEPARDVNWTARDLDLRVRVYSAGPLKSVVLTREGRRPLRQVFDTSRLPRSEQGYVLHLRIRLTAGVRPDAAAAVDVAALPEVAGVRHVSVPWELLAEVNRLRVEAVSDAGTRAAEVVVNYLYEPVRLQLTRLRVRGKEPLVLPADLRDVAAAPDGRVTLEGQISWDEDKADLLTPSSRVHVRVNGLKLVPVPLGVPRGGERRLSFEVPLVLPRAQGNEIEVELTGVKVEGPGRRAFRVDCLDPAKQPQRLHVLIVRHGEQARAPLAQRVLDALQPDPGCERLVHGPFTGTVRRGQVLNELRLVKQQVDLRAQRGLINNLVVVYIEGAEAISALGHFFAGSVKPDELELRRHALTCDSIADYLAEMAGAQLLLLDVARPATIAGGAEDRIAHWPYEVRPGVFRYATAVAEKGAGGRVLLIGDLAKAGPASVDLGGVAERVARNFRERFAEPPERAAGWLGGSARGHEPANLADVLYHWHYPSSYARLRIGRDP